MGHHKHRFRRAWWFLTTKRFSVVGVIIGCIIVGAIDYMIGVYR